MYNSAYTKELDIELLQGLDDFGLMQLWWKCQCHTKQKSFIHLFNFKEAFQSILDFFFFKLQWIPGTLGIAMLYTLPHIQAIYITNPATSMFLKEEIKPENPEETP